MKLLQPADPISMPYGSMFWNEVWIIVTIGQITTKAISAIAGPSQSSGWKLASRRRSVRAGRLAGPGSAERASAVAMSDMCLSLAPVHYGVTRLSQLLTHEGITTARRRAQARAGPS